MRCERCGISTATLSICVSCEETWKDLKKRRTRSAKNTKQARLDRHAAKMRGETQEANMTESLGNLAQAEGLDGSQSWHARRLIYLRETGRLTRRAKVA